MPFFNPDPILQKSAFIYATLNLKHPYWLKMVM